MRRPLKWPECPSTQGPSKHPQAKMPGKVPKPPSFALIVSACEDKASSDRNVKLLQSFAKQVSFVIVCLFYLHIAFMNIVLRIIV